MGHEHVPGNPTLPARNGLRRIPLGFGGITAKVGDHIAHVYDTREEMLRVLGPYVATGLRNGDRCLVYAPRAIPGLRKWLTSEGINPEKVEESGQLLTIPGCATAWTHSRMIARIQRDTEADSYHLLRVAGDGCGRLGDRESPSELLKWESIYDISFAQDYPIIGLCQFDPKRFRGDTIIAVLRAHPLFIVGDKVIRNPLYIPPSQYGLTSREMEILRHVALGEKDREIASVLGIGERTVESHVANIRNKLGVTSRAGAAARVVREGIIE